MFRKHESLLNKLMSIVIILIAACFVAMLYMNGTFQKITAADSTLSVEEEENPEGDVLQNVVIAGRDTSQITLGWSMDGKADGYIIEQLDGDEWTQLAKLEDLTTETYVVEDLAPGTEYTFRIKAYWVRDQQEQGGAFTEISGYTRPEQVDKFKVKDKTANSVTLAWKQDDSSKGYRIYIWNGNEWTRVAKIKVNTDTEYTVEGLEPSTKYRFKICGTIRDHEGHIVKSKAVSLKVTTEE